MNIFHHFKYNIQFILVSHAMLHAKNAMDLLKMNALNVIHLFMKIFSWKIIFFSNVFQNNKHVKILNMFMLEPLIIAMAKINAFLNVNISQSLMVNQKFVNIASILIQIFQFFLLIRHYVYHLAIMMLFQPLKFSNQYFLVIHAILHAKNALDPHQMNALINFQT